MIITIDTKCVYFTRCSMPRKAARQADLAVVPCMVFLTNKHLLATILTAS